MLEFNAALSTVIEVSEPSPQVRQLRAGAKPERAAIGRAAGQDAPVLVRRELSVRRPNLSAR